MFKLELWKRLDFKLAVAFSIVVLAIAIPYWVAALQLPHFCDAWPCSPPAHYLPWPWAPDRCIDVVVPMGFVDKIFCYLAATKLFVLVILAEVLLAAWVGKRVAKWIESSRNSKGKDNSKENATSTKSRP